MILTRGRIILDPLECWLVVADGAHAFIHTHVEPKIKDREKVSSTSGPLEVSFLQFDRSVIPEDILLSVLGALNHLSGLSRPMEIAMAAYMILCASANAIVSYRIESENMPLEDAAAEFVQLLRRAWKSSESMRRDLEKTITDGQ
jgi:hypothetical protein